MSAFFLVSEKNTSLIPIAEAMFEKRNILNGHRYSLSCGELLLYPKQMLDVDNHTKDEKGALFCIGTPIYKGLSYSDSQKQLLTDFENNRLETKLLLGEYVLIFDVAGQASVLTDATGMYKLFADKEGRYVSSSFLAALACTPHTINKSAVAEQALYGFVAAPDTLVNEIVCLKNAEERKNVSWVQWLKHVTMPDLKPSKTEEDSVTRQHDAIKDYMQDVKALVEAYGSECGMSGGSDSRLIYASVNTSCAPMKSVHTHCTSNVHKGEINIVKQVVALKNTPLKMVPTTYLSQCDGEVADKTLKENVLYYDARNAENIGAFSQTHTQWYRKATADGSGVTFSGIAGEIYRDFYHTQIPCFRFQRWMESRVFARGIKSMIPASLYEETMKKIIAKVANETGLTLHHKVSPIIAKRFFDRYRIPNALSNVVHANNQMSFYLAPFTEASLIRAAKPDKKWHEHCGAYEGKITASFMPEAAALPSSHGYVLSDIPRSILLKWQILSRLPFFVWDGMTKKENGNPTNAKRFSELLGKSKYLQKAMDCFVKLFPDWNLNTLHNGSVLLNNFVFTVCAVYEIEQLSQ